MYRFAWLGAAGTTKLCWHRRGLALGQPTPDPCGTGYSTYTDLETALQALQQRNEESEQTLQQANLLILALHTLIEVAEQELQVPIRKKSGTKQS